MKPRLPLLFALFVIGALVLWVLRPFLLAACWAIILVYVSWPLYRRLHRATGDRSTLSALVMTAVLAALMSLPLVGLALLAESELMSVYATIGVGADRPPLRVPAAIAGIPWLGATLQVWLDTHTTGPGWLSALVADQARRWADELTQILASIVRNVLTGLFALMTAFFLFRDGAELGRQLGVVAKRFLGSRSAPYLATATRMIGAVVFGVLLAALAQGAMAALGYWLLDVRAPILLGVATAMFSLVPLVGSALIWVGVGLWLAASGDLWKGFAMFAWGFLLVHPIDNILRPLVISGSARLPLLVTIFGVLGGASAFGLIGIFLGPVILALGLTVWREWLEGQGVAGEAEVVHRTDDLPAGGL